MITKDKIKQLEEEARKKREAKGSESKPSSCKYCPTCAGC